MDPDQMAEARNLQWHYFQCLQTQDQICDVAAREARERAARNLHGATMYYDHEYVAPMDPDPRDFDPYHPGNENRKSKTPEQLEAFQEQIRRARFGALMKQFSVWLLRVLFLCFGVLCAGCLCWPRVHSRMQDVIC